MATHDYIISNASGAAVRADLNNALAAIASNNSSATEPTTTYAYQWWADTGSSPTVMKLRNAANSGWVTLFQLDGEWTVVPFENGTAAAPSIYFKDSGTDTGIYSPGTDQVAITTGGTQRATVDSSGRLLVGTSTSISNVYVGGAAYQSPLQVIGNAAGYGNGLTSLNYSAGGYGATLTLGSSKNATVGVNGALASGDDLAIINFVGNDGTNFRTGAYIIATADATVSTADVPTRLTFWTKQSGVAGPTERMRINNDGNVMIGKTASSLANAGVELAAAGSNITANSAIPLYINRGVDDGTLIEFRQANSTEGSISVSGTTVSYNGAHLSRWSQIQGVEPYDKDQRPEMLRGTVMSNLDEMCDWTCPESGECQDNEQLNKTKISDVEGDKNVAGVFQSWDDDDDTWVNDYYLAMTGDFVIRIAECVTVERGDLLMSAGDGTAKPQDDDIIRSKTIAKVTSTNVSCTHPDGSYCVPCVLMAC